MDLSTNYINMCEKAEEIQKEWLDGKRFEDGIWLYSPEFGIRVWMRSLIIGHPILHIWLPRQDQLQDMLISIIWQMAHREKDYVVCIMPEKQNKTIYCYAPTAEQVLLELVMLTLYVKKWNGKTWEK